MPIQLDRILYDISAEKTLHPNNLNANKQDIDDAWTRVGNNNKLSVHEARSIFKVLQKKYEQEKSKPKSTWKLFSVMESIHNVDDSQTQIEEAALPMEEEEEFEMLEVQEEEDVPASANSSTEEYDVKPNAAALAAAAASSAANEKSADVKPPLKYNNSNPNTPIKAATAIKQEKLSPPAEEKKLLNTLASATPRSSGGAQNASLLSSASALRQKGIIVKKTTGSAGPASQQPQSHQSQQQSNKSSLLHQTKPQQQQTKPMNVQEASKRRPAEESLPSSILVKRPNLGQQQQQHQQQQKISTNNKPNSNAAARRSDEASHQRPQTPSGINVITIPGRPELANGSASSSSGAENGYSPRIEDIDFRNDIIFEAAPADADLLTSAAAISSKVNASGNAATATTVTDINMGNFQYELPKTFFRNLCSSSRHEALGLYVANVMNRIPLKAAAKLELRILQALLDAQTPEADK